MTVKVHIEGLREIKTALRTLPDSTAKGVMRRILKKRAQPIATRARDLAPEDKGPNKDKVVLKDSILVGTRLTRHHRRLHKKKNKDDVEMFVGARTLPHAHMQEFGTSRHGAQPFMRPAWDAEKNGVLKGLADDLWSEIRKTVQRLKKRKLKTRRARG